MSIWAFVSGGGSGVCKEMGGGTVRSGACRMSKATLPAKPRLHRNDRCLRPGDYLRHFRLCYVSSIGQTERFQGRGLSESWCTCCKQYTCI